MNKPDDAQGPPCPECGELQPVPDIKMDSYRCRSCNCEYILSLEYCEEEMRRKYNAKKV